MFACRAAVPVVPARIFGSFDAFSPSRGLQLGTPIHVTYGRVLQPPDFDDPAAGKDRYQRASEKIMSAIAALEVPQARRRLRTASPTGRAHSIKYQVSRKSELTTAPTAS